MRHSIKLIALIGLCGCITACIYLPFITKEDTLPPQFHGIWQSNGYGYLIDANSTEIKAYNITPEICIADENLANAFSSYALDEVPNAKLITSTDGQNLYFSEPFETYAIQFQRVSQVPERCNITVPDDPISTFNAFASLMRTHYAFFDLYRVDWEATVKQARQEISNDLDDDRLFKLLSAMIYPLNDAHLSLSRTVDGTVVGYSPKRGKLTPEITRLAAQQKIQPYQMTEKLIQKYWQQDIRQNVLKGQGKMAGHNMVQYGITADDIGYIAFLATYNYAGKGTEHPAEDRAELQSILDDAISLFNERQVTAVILDLSVNYGGHNFPARDVAARFTDQAKLAFSKRAHDALHQAPYPIFVTPYPEPEKRFSGPVYVLTSETTVSGGEVMVLALRALPNVTQIGESTSGALSDILTKHLPNGWQLNISNEIYIDSNSVLWEGRGITPDIPLEVFDAKHPFGGNLNPVQQVIQRVHQDTSGSP